jgi:PAS domain S-box-containing protein
VNGTDGAQLALPERARAMAALLRLLDTPACLVWGEGAAMLGNDAWARLLGSAQPHAPALPARACVEAMEAAQRGAPVDLGAALWPILISAGVEPSAAALSCRALRSEDRRVEGLLVQLTPAAASRPVRNGTGREPSPQATPRAAFLLRLEDMAAALDDPAAIAALGADMLARELGAQGAGFTEIAGAQADTAASTTSRLSVPVWEDGARVAVLTLWRDDPRGWDAEETATAQDAARRIWAARCRADAAATARASAVRLRRALDVEGLALLFVAPDGTLTGANDAFLRLSGQTREAVDSGRLRWGDMIPPERASDHDAAMARLAETGRLAPCEMEHVTVGGRRASLLCTARDLGDGTFAVIAHDITGWQEAEDAPRQADRRLREAHAIAGIAPFDWTISGTGHGALPAALSESVGMGAGAFGGAYENWIATIHPDDRAEVGQCVDAAFGSGVLEGEWRVLRPDGSVAWALVRGRVARDAQGRPVRLTGAQVDITERVRSEESVRLLLEEFDRQLEDLRRHLRDDRS